MRHLRIIGFLVLFCGPSLSSIVLAEPPISAAEIDHYLRERKNSPLAGEGESFLKNGERRRIDPRLVVAIAGNESTFGKHITRGTFNAWNWLRPNPNFASWDEGIMVVTEGLRRLYFDTLKKTTIPAIGATYCGEGCEHWVDLVTLFYHNELGGDLSDLTYRPSLKVSWVRTNGPDIDNTVFTAALVSTSLGELFAATNRGCFDNAALGVLRSVDHGITWTPINFGFLSTNVRTLLLTPNSDLFAGTHVGVFRYDRSLGAWNPSGLGGVDVNVLRATTRGLWAADSCFCTGLRQSTDNGQTWQHFGAGLPPCVNAVVEHPSGNLYVGTGTSGVYQLPVGAVSWSPVNEGLGSSDLHSLIVTPLGDLFAGTIAGLFRRSNGSTQWTALTQGLPNDGIQSIIVSPQGKLLVGTFSHGIYTSADNGNSWTEMNSGIPDVSRTVGAFAFDSQGFVYVSVGSVVYRSTAPLR